MQVDHNEIARLTEQYGGAWGIMHTRRLLNLVEVIGQGLDYQQEAVWLTAHLHDWGGYAPWAQKGVDYVARSVEVAQEILTTWDCEPELKALVMECIALHHEKGTDRSLEAILIRDADCLDFLGVVGVLRDFSKNPKDMQKAVSEVRRRLEKVPPLLHLPKAKEIAVGRIKTMDDLMANFELESFGCY